MADHIEQQLREAVALRCTGLPTTADRVHAYRVVNPAAMDALPLLSIYTPTDEAEPLTLHGPAASYQRATAMHVIAAAKGLDDLDGKLDTIRKEVEAVLATPLTVAGKVLRLLYQGSEADYDTGDANIATREMRFTVTLFNVADQPDVLV